MQKISKKIFFIIIVFCIIIGNSFCLAENTVTTKGKAKIDNNIESENSINQVIEEKIEEPKVELSYPEIEAKKTKIGPLTMEEVIALAIAMQSFLGIIIAISLYVKSRKDRDEDDWEEDDYINEVKEKEQEEPKAMKELKEEAASKEPKAIEKLEDEKKLEKIRKERETALEDINIENKEEDKTIDNKNKEEIKKETTEDTQILNSKHQKALDDFYKYAEEIKKEKKSKRGKGKHSM